MSVTPYFKFPLVDGSETFLPLDPRELNFTVGSYALMEVPTLEYKTFIAVPVSGPLKVLFTLNLPPSTTSNPLVVSSSLFWSNNNNNFKKEEEEEDVIIDLNEGSN